MGSWSVRHVTPAFRTYAGGTALNMLSRELERAGTGRVMVVCSASIQRHKAALGRVEAAIGKRLVATFGEAREHSPLPVVLQASEMLRESRAEAVVVLGGGSAIVTARAATILAAEGRDVRRLCTRWDGGRLVSPRLSAPKIPQWIVPSTPTTAYAKAGAAVRDPQTGERLALFDPKARAAGVFFDPVVAATAPESLVRSSALNALAMSVDGLQSGTDDPLAEASLRHALLLLRDWLPRIGTEPPGVVGPRLMFAALLVGQGSDHVGAGLAQAVSHAAGPRSAVGNGVIEALLLPHTMRFNLGVTDDGLRAVASVLRPANEATPAGAIDAVAELLTRARVPARLRDAGVAREAIGEIVDHTLGDWAATTVPRPADRDGLKGLLDRAW